MIRALGLDRLAAIVDMGDDAVYVWAAVVMVVAGVAWEVLALWVARRRAADGARPWRLSRRGPTTTPSTFD